VFKCGSLAKFDVWMLKEDMVAVIQLNVERRKLTDVAQLICFKRGLSEQVIRVKHMLLGEVHVHCLLIEIKKKEVSSTY
jgi:hypothetical protein